MTTRNHVADICLYGNLNVGAEFIVQTADGRMFNDSEPSMTGAVWTALGIIRDKCGYMTGQARIFAPGGERMAVVDINHVGYYGDLTWEAALVYTIALEDLGIS